MTLIAASVAIFHTSTQASSITLTNGDGLGASSFNTAGRWSVAAAPSAGNDYSVGNFTFRTPASGASFAFAGDALTISNTGPYSQGFFYKGTGATGIITVTNLILGGGLISHGNGVGDVFNLAGNMNVTLPSTIYAKQGNINLLNNLSGTGNLTIAQTDAPTEDNRYVSFYGTNTSYTGRIIVAGRIRILSEESLGGNPASFAADQLVLDNAVTGNGGWLTVTNSMTIDDANRGITVGAAGAHIFVNYVNITNQINLTIASPITGGILNKRGGGILTLSGNNSYTGGLVFYTATAGSQLNINSATALGTGTLNLLGGANPVLLDNTSGSAITVSTSNPQTWANTSIQFLGSNSLDLGAGAATLTASTTLAVSNNTLTVAAIADDGLTRSLTKTGPGTLVVTGGISLLGNTTVSQGTLALTTTPSLSSPIITVAGGATLDVGAIGGLSLGAVQTLQGSGTVIGSVDAPSGSSIAPGTSAGTLAIVSNLTLQAGSILNYEVANVTTVGAGVNDHITVGGDLTVAGPSVALNVTYLNAVPAVLGKYTLISYTGSFIGSVSDITVPPGFTITNNTASKTIELLINYVPVNLTWRGDGLINAWDINTTSNWNANTAPFINADTVNFDDSGSNTPAIFVGAPVFPAAVNVNAAQNFNFTGSAITTADFAKSGSGSLVLETDLVAGSGSIINAGTVQVGNNGTTGFLGGGNLTNNGALVFARADGITVTNSISGTGTLTQNGTSDVGLAASNSYSGLTTIAAGRVFLINSSSLGSTTAGTVVSNGAELFITQNVNVDDEPLAVSGFGSGGIGGALHKGGGGVTFYAGAVTLLGDSMFNIDGGATLNLTNAAGVNGSAANANLTLSGGGVGNVSGPINLNGGGILTHQGPGAWFLAGANSFSLATVTGGTLGLANNNALGTNTAVVLSSTTGGPGLSGTRLTLSGGVTIDNTRSLSMPSAGAGAIRSAFFGTGPGVTNIWNGTVTLTGDFSAANNIGFGMDANSTFIINGNVTADASFPGKLLVRGNNTGLGILAGTVALDAATGQFHLDDGATWVLSGAGNTWATNVFANSSQLRLGINNGLPTASGIIIASGGNNRIDLNGYNQQLGAMETGPGLNIYNSSAATDSTLTYNGGVSSYGGALTSGAKKLNLTIAAGTLALTNAASLNITNSTVSIASGAALQLNFTGTNRVAGLILNGVAQTNGYYNSANASPYMPDTGTLFVAPVTPPGPSGPAVLTNSISGNTLSFSWPSGLGWRLQAQTNAIATGLATNWAYLTDGSVSSTNITVDPSAPTVFFRLAHP